MLGMAQLAITRTAQTEVLAHGSIVASFYQHTMTLPQQSTSKDLLFLEERAFPTSSSITNTLQKDLCSFAGVPRLKSEIDRLREWYHNFGMKQLFDHVPLAMAVDMLIEENPIVENLLRSRKLLSWFGTREPNDQKKAIESLAAKLKDCDRTKDHLPIIFGKGKERDDLYRVLASSVERKWLMNLPTDDLLKTLHLPHVEDNEEFLKRLAFSIWSIFGLLGKEDFDALMLDKLLERSNDDMMWAPILYKLQNDDTVIAPLSSVFDALIRSYDTAAAAEYQATPSEAVQILTNPNLLTWYDSIRLTHRNPGAILIDDLLSCSKDELMWAKLLYIQRNDDTAHTIYSEIFDALLRSPDAPTAANHVTPCEAVQILTDPQLLIWYSTMRSNHQNPDALVISKLISRSQDELMWAKLLYMLRNDVRTPRSGALKHFWRFWMDTSHHTAGSSTHEYTPKEAVKLLMSRGLFNAYRLTQFIGDDPDKLLLAELLDRSNDEIMWAQALHLLRDHDNVPTPLSGVYIGLLDMLASRPYDAAEHQYSITENETFLVSPGLYKLYVFVRWAGIDPNTFLLSILLQRSADKKMWTQLLRNLPHTYLSGVYDALLRSLDEAVIANRIASDAISS